MAQKLTSAFDTVEHSIFNDVFREGVLELKSMLLVGCLHGFLYNRSFTVRVGNDECDITALRFGFGFRFKIVPPAHMTPHIFFIETVYVSPHIR